MYNIIEIYKRLIVSRSSCSSRWFCFIALHFFVTMYTHRTHTYMIMFCSTFTNHNRMLVVHFVVTSEIDAALKTQPWPTFVRIDVNSRKVRWIVLSLGILQTLCDCKAYPFISGTTMHVYIEPTKLIVRNNHCNRKITSKIKYNIAILSCFEHTFMLLSSVWTMPKLFFVSSGFWQLSF